VAGADAFQAQLVAVSGRWNDLMERCKLLKDEEPKEQKRFALSKLMDSLNAQPVFYYLHF